MRAFGVAPEVLEEARRSIEERNRTAELTVWPENWHATLVFIDMSTQWRVVAAPARLMWLGLDRAALPITLAAVKPTVPATCRRPLHELMPQLSALEQRGAQRRNG